VNYQDFIEQEQFLVDCITNAMGWITDSKTDGERQAAVTALNNLRTQIAALPKIEKPKRKPRRKLTTIEKFDKKNSRREAIMAQRERNANE